jgi:hypothetical protein
MEIVVTHRGRLTSKYGESGWAKIENAVNEYLDALGSAGIDAGLYLLDEAVPQDSDSEEEWKTIKTDLWDQCTGRNAKYVALLGGDEIVPFYRLIDNTANGRLDQYIYSDSYYFDFNENEDSHWPDIAVGRFPDGGNDDGELLVKQLSHASHLHRGGGVIVTNKCVGFSTNYWQEASKQTYRRIDDKLTTLRLSPPLGLEKSLLKGVSDVLNPGTFQDGSILFFNLHGHHKEPRWWGESRMLGVSRSPDLVNLALLNKVADLSNSILLCEACHGAAVSCRTPADSLALCALGRGAAAFFGCTVTSYTVTLPSGMPMTASGIDAIFNYLIHQILRNKARLGDALRDAKQYHHQFNNAYDEKNVLGLVLLGDPMLSLVKQFQTEGEARES